ncbi:hypothetical protein O9K51_08118 [Purpureocillium lavendulum]|uniref:Uncharacterized protein n=1 Tax=Purpureocillium lavendulum TaxID=1247861 RepID=A0AB34FM70_9HYPO|nr:hypothetical protein O9K51_08118 [Purpureocillium lavendulum]
MRATFILGAFVLANTTGAVKVLLGLSEAQALEILEDAVKESPPMSEAEARKHAAEWNEELTRKGIEDMGLCSTESQYCKAYTGVAERAPGSDGQWRWRGYVSQLKCPRSYQCLDTAHGCYVTDLFGSNQKVWCGIPFHKRPTVG